MDHAPGVGFCRDCLTPVQEAETRCRACHGPRVVRHAELDRLSIAHIDCDAFYAAVEKRDDPGLADKPLIIGGGRRGVVSTACYIARISGVRSAMPMFKALKLCPDAVVLKPDMAKYVAVGREVRALMLALTPMVEPLSIDEAFLDLTGTERLHGRSPALSLAELARRIEHDIGITVSIGLSYNKFLAKIASDLDKPRGFAVIGHAETLPFLASRPVTQIWGVGRAMQADLAAAGITTIAQLQRMERNDLIRRFGAMGQRLHALSRGEDHRRVSPHEEIKSISAETTFEKDIRDANELERILWRLSEKVSRRAKAKGFAGSTVTLKLKGADFRIRTRNRSLPQATWLAHRMFDAARSLLRTEADGTPYRLIGIGITNLEQRDGSGAEADLDSRHARRTKAELAMDALRVKFGAGTIETGRGFRRRIGPDDD